MQMMSLLVIRHRRHTESLLPAIQDSVFLEVQILRMFDCFGWTFGMLFIVESSMDLLARLQFSYCSNVDRERIDKVKISILYIICC
ncbi:hypothetical protein P8452_37975 [Trifolium repens]|nr:hypothetical protein P8452_37975 [Trifolium repens]